MSTDKYGLILFINLVYLLRSLYRFKD